MPTYEYQCEACGHRFEQFQSITAEPIRKCPACARRKVRRLISGGGAIIFKGSGFYATDYRSESYRQSAKTESGAGSGSAAKADSASKGDTASKSDSAARPEPAKSRAKDKSAKAAG